jgi:hypothetical protein
MEGLEIKKETFVKLDQEGQSEILFDYLDYMKTKLDNLEEKKQADHTQLVAVGGIFGFLGGLIAVLGKWLIGQ